MYELPKETIILINNYKNMTQENNKCIKTPLVDFTIYNNGIFNESDYDFKKLEKQFNNLFNDVCLEFEKIGFYTAGKNPDDYKTDYANLYKLGALRIFLTIINLEYFIPKDETGYDFIRENHLKMIGAEEFICIEE